jgi:uncharacterized protein
MKSFKNDFNLNSILGILSYFDTISIPPKFKLENRLSIKKIFGVFLFLFCINSIFSLDVPFLSGRVIDEVGILGEPAKKNLESKLRDHEKQTSNQVVVLIIPTLAGENLEEYSLKVASTWKLGQKKKDNGVLLLIVKNDRKLRIEVGYGLEATLTDVLCNQIIRKEITPRFKQNNFPLGIEKGMESILAALDGNYKAELETDKTNLLDSDSNRNDGDFFFRFFFGIIFFIVITPFTILSAFLPAPFGWFLYCFLIPFYTAFPLVVFGIYGLILLAFYLIGIFLFRMFLAHSERGKKFSETILAYLEKNRVASEENRRLLGSSTSGVYSSRSGGSFSGGGGSFGGGGSSGSW